MCSKDLPTKYTRFSLRINYIAAFKLNLSQEIYREYCKRTLKIHLTVFEEYSFKTSYPELIGNIEVLVNDLLKLLVKSYIKYNIKK